MTGSDHNHQIYGHVNIGQHTHGFNGIPVYTSRDIPPGKMYGMGGAIYGRPEDMDRLIHQQFLNDVIKSDPIFTDTPRKPMSTIDKIRQERREKREREELEAKFQEWDEIFASERADVGFFTRDIGDKTYRYAAIHADKRWYLTGAETCGFTVEDFIAWLIAKEVLPENFVWLEAAG